MKYTVKFTTRFKKDLKLAKKQGNVFLGMTELCYTLYVPSEAPVICLILLF